MTVPAAQASNWAPIRMAELLAAVTTKETVEGALDAVVDGVAETFDAEVTLLVGRGEVRQSLGFGQGDVPSTLISATDGVIGLPGIGLCHVRCVALTDPELDRLIIARTSGPYGEVEAALLAGIARTIELGLRTVRALERERKLREAAAAHAARNAQLVSDLRFHAAFDETLVSISQILLTGDPSTTEAAVATAVERLGEFLGLRHARIELESGKPWVSWGVDDGRSDAPTVGMTLASLIHDQATLVLGVADQGPLNHEESALLEVVAGLITNALDRRGTHVALQAANQELRTSNANLERANRDLVRANTLKDEFVSMTSHELRTPLTAIQGFAETVVRHGDRLTPELIQDLGQRIHGQAVRLTRLVGDILDISRLESGGTQMRAQPFALQKVVSELVSGAWPDGDDIETDVNGTHMTADPDHVARILVNLVDNARKYGAAPIEITGRREGAWAVVRVTDHGDGVPPSFEPRLFQKFQQASSGTRRSSTGTGLGLAIVRRLAHLNGGEAGYERSPTGGASFWVRLPAADPHGLTAGSGAGHAHLV